MKTDSDNMRPLFDAILRHVPPRSVMQKRCNWITTLDYSDFLGQSSSAVCTTV